VKEFELTIRLRNNCLKARRLAMGLSAPALARKVGINYGLYVKLEGLRCSPLSRRADQTWLPSVLKLATFYGESPETLFPDAVLLVAQPEKVVALEADHVMALAGWQAEQALPPTPEECCQQMERTRAVRDALEHLPTRERGILERRFTGDETLEGIGKTLGLSRDRVRQLEVRALERLRSRSWLPENVRERLFRS
jgi:RNA polymerase sigma factor (sigma-70 family)